jgi:hypothetical protein
MDFDKSETLSEKKIKKIKIESNQEIKIFNKNYE